MSPGTIFKEIQSLYMNIYTVVSDNLYISLYIYTDMNDIESNYLSFCQLWLNVSYLLVYINNCEWKFAYLLDYL